VVDAGEAGLGAKRVVVGAWVEVAAPVAALLAEEDLHAVRALDRDEVGFVPVPVPGNDRRAQRRGALRDRRGVGDVKANGGHGEVPWGGGGAAAAVHEDPRLAGLP
jgi:hypothetical protein